MMVYYFSKQKNKFLVKRGLKIQKYTNFDSKDNGIIGDFSNLIFKFQYGSYIMYIMLNNFRRKVTFVYFSYICLWYNLVSKYLLGSTFYQQHAGDCAYLSE